MRKNKRGSGSKILEKVGAYVIRESRNIDKDGKVTSSNIGIYRGKKLIEAGFKNRIKAVEKAKTLK